jgi:hypothetical protein
MQTKTFHNIVQGVLTGNLGYGLMNGDKYPKESHCATVYDQLYLYECRKELNPVTTVWDEICDKIKDKTLLTLSLPEFIALRNKLKKEHESNRPILIDMSHHYMEFRRRAHRYHNAVGNLLNKMNNYIENKLAAAGCE